MSFYKLRLIKFSFTVFVIISGSLFSTPAKATEMSTATLSSIADASMLSAYPGNTYGSNQMISVLYDASTDARTKSVIKFDLSGVPAGSTIDSADMRLYMDACTSDPGTIYVSRMISIWTESTFDWNIGKNMHPSTNGSIQIVNPPCGGHGYDDFYITDIMKAWMSGSSNYGVMLYLADNTTGNFSRGFGSKEYTGPKPQLVVNYYTPASTPAGQPAGQGTTGTTGSTSSIGTSNKNSNSASVSSGTNTNGFVAGDNVNSNSIDSPTAETSGSTSQNGKVDQAKNFLSKLWANPIYKIIMIMFSILFLGAIIAVIIILVVYFRKKKQKLLAQVSSTNK